MAKSSIIWFLSCCSYLLSIYSSLVWAWSVESRWTRRGVCHSRPQQVGPDPRTCLFAQTDDNNKKKKGYQFGDFTKSFAKKAAESVNKITGKDEYQFGDLSRWLDQSAKQRLNDITGKQGEYEFGDLSRWADSRIKEKMNNFTQKEEYELFDVSKEVLRRAASGEYKLEDMVLLCKILVSFGVGFSPIASALPAKFLLDIFNYSIEQEIGGRLLEALAIALDERFKEAVTGDKKYQVGDATKAALLKFIGKENGRYEFVDITKAITSQLEEHKSKGSKLKEFGVANKDSGGASGLSSELDKNVLLEVEEWDREIAKKGSEIERLGKN